jgi:ribonuclease D
MSNNSLYIDTPAGLDDFCRQLSGAGWLAMDTEFLREKTYYPRLCLIQIATPELTACIDPIALDNIDPLLDILYDPGVTKVVHAARQDLEIFFNMRNSVPGPVFDTQIAALLLGYPDQVGYATLVEGELGVSLDKSHSRTDWTQRPLSALQIEYAADDVIYLVQTYEKMIVRLDSLGRLSWPKDDFERLIDSELYTIAPEQAWMKVRGGERLTGSSLAALQGLAAWREKTARAVDRPRNWILRDDVMVDLARFLPADGKELVKIRGLLERSVRKYGSELLTILQSSKELGPEPLPDRKRKIRLTPEQEALVDSLMAIVRLAGSQNQLAPTVLATRKQLEKLVLGDNDLAVMKGWRKNVAGDLLAAFLDGSAALTVSDEKLLLGT